VRVVARRRAVEKGLFHRVWSCDIPHPRPLSQRERGGRSADNGREKVPVGQPARGEGTKLASFHLFIISCVLLKFVESRCGAVADAPFPHPAHRTRTCGFPASGSRTRKHRTQGPVGRRLRILNWNWEVHRLAPLSLSFSSASDLLELRSLPSTGVTQLPRYYEPVRHPKRPGLSLAGLQLGFRFPPMGLPVLQQLPVC
jgi:hypothetical protein